MTVATPRAAAMHAEFDRGFAEPVRPPESAHTDFLRIRIAGEPYAVALADVSSLHADLQIVALPSRAPELRGVAAIRTAVVPIYDLGVALGAPATASRWTLLVRSGTAGFSVEGYEGYVRIPDISLRAAGSGGHLRGQFVIAGQPRSIVDLGSVLTAIETRGRGPAVTTGAKAGEKAGVKDH